MDRILLVGAESVESAARSISSAAGEMQRAAGNLEDSLYRHRQFLDDWLSRLQAVMEAKP